MKIGLKDLDGTIGAMLKARIANVQGPQAAQAADAGLREAMNRRYKGMGWEFAGRVISTICVGIVSGITVGAAIGPTGAMVGLGMAGAYAGGMGSLFYHMFRYTRTSWSDINAGELRAAAQAAVLSTAERTYVEIVASILEAGDTFSDETGRDLLQTLGAVLDHARYLDNRLDRLRKAASTESLSDLEEERKRLAERVTESGDQQARDDLSNSLLMCEERLKNARALEPAIHRMDAQREVLRQTLLSIQATVVRLQAAPEAANPPDIHGIRLAVSELTVQTRAVEEAVQEVLAVTSG